MSASVLSEPDGKKASVSSLDLNALNEAGAALEAETEAEVGATLEQEQSDDDLLAPEKTKAKLESVKHLLIAVLLAFVLGYYHIHWIFTVLLFIVTLQIDQRYKLLSFKRFYKVKRAEQRVRSNDPPVVSSPDPINMMMQSVWPNISNYVTVEAQRFLGAFVKDALHDSKPPAVESVYVRTMTLGKIPPEFRLLRSHKMGTFKNRFKLDIEVHYRGEFSLTLTTVLRIGAVGQKMSITLRDVVFTIPVTVEANFSPEFPFFKWGAVSLFRKLESNWMDFTVDIMGVMGALSLAVIKKWVIQAITSAVNSTMAPPNRVQFGQVPKAQNKDKEEGEDEEEHLLVPLKQGEWSPFAKYHGYVKVVLVEARNLLKTDVVGSTDAYCKLQVNDVWYTSPKVPNTLDPIWNMSYEFPLEVSNKEQTLKIKVKDWDMTGKNDEQGQAEIVLSRLEKNKATDLRVPLVHSTKPQRGELHLTVTYCPDEDLIKKDEKE